MRFKYLLYLEARAKLDSSGITARVERARKSYSIGIRGFVSDNDVSGMVTEMKDQGFFKTFPQDQWQDFKKNTNAMFQAREKFHWTVGRNEGAYPEVVEAEDLLLLMGYDASQILDPKEIWDFKRFGFSNIPDFAGSVGVLINEAIHNSTFRKGYSWQVNTSDKKVFANEVTGDENCDMRVFQTDITPYATTDPFGNKVSFRPELDPDRRGIIAYHSTEGELLSIVLKYVEQIGIKPESLRDGARGTLEWATSLGQGGGTCAEHFGGCDQDARMFFTGWTVPLQRLDKKNTATQNSFDGLISNGDGIYMAYLDADNNLAFAYEPKEGKRMPKKDVRALYYPDDADHLIKGLLYQSAKGFGRTSCRQLIDILGYRLSDQFQVDVAEMQAEDRKLTQPKS